MMLLQLRALIGRNCKIFFKDKGVFFPSLISPLILLFLFIAFLGNVYRDSVRSAVGGLPVSDGLVESVAGGWLVSSLLAVCAVTIAFTANTIMVQDRVTGARNDLAVSPVSPHVLALSYFVATFLVTASICLVAYCAGLAYLAIAGLHLSVQDGFAAAGDALLLVLFGTSLSSIVCNFLKSQGGVTAVQATVSAAYGFLCGAYMPLAGLAKWLKDALMFLPGTYGTGLLHLHLMGGAIRAFAEEGVPRPLIEGLMEGFDCTLTFFGGAVPEWACRLVLCGAILLLTAGYVALCAHAARRGKRQGKPSAAES